MLSDFPTKSGRVERPEDQSAKEQFIVGLIIALIGAIVLYFTTLLPWMRVREASNWLEVTGDIVEAKLETNTNPDSPDSFNPRIVYHYRLKGTDYRSNRYGFSPWSRSRDQANQILNQNRVGQSVTVFVNPIDPNEAVLCRRLELSWLGVIIGMGFLIVGSLFLLSDG